MSTPQQEVERALGMDGKRKPFNWMWIALVIMVGGGIYFLQQEPPAQQVEYVTQTLTRGGVTSYCHRHRNLATDKAG